MTSSRQESSNPKHLLTTHDKGDSGEDQAIEYLLNRGYTVISRKYRSRKGEIDCIVRDPDGTLVFVEVKSSRTTTCGHPFSWVTPAKQRTITRMARQYLAEHQITRTPCRFDVIAIVNGVVDHLRNAFLAC